jgi:phosphoglucosamine mutase
MAAPLACVPPASSARRADRRLRRTLHRILQEHVPTELDLKGWRIVVDCAHGAGYHVAPPVFHELGADVIAIGDEPNGMNINDGVGATHPKRCAARCSTSRADSASRSTATATGC